MKKQNFIIDGELTLSEVQDIISTNCTIELSKEILTEVNECRLYLDNKLAESDSVVYGINTGFGSLCDTLIPDKDLAKLQENLVMSHACGMGDLVPPEIVRLMLLLKIQSLSYGRSGIREQTLKALVDLFNHNILPAVYELGSLGASGDLAPLAHLSLALLGQGQVWENGQLVETADVLKRNGLKPITLASKEGLALLNGTQFMSAYGNYCILKAKRLAKWADIIGALSLDAFDGRIEPFHVLIQEVRPHNGQIMTARLFRELLGDSELISQEKDHVQDPYSFRCIPQVHGASRDAINYAADVFSKEINAVTDNPTIFPDDDLIISAGNFHGQPLAITLDFLGIALSELGNISERRTYQLISGNRKLPHYLVANSGLNSGFMIPQYTAASIVSQNKQLATPASVDSIESSQGQEDHVSMGANAATKALKIVNNLERVLAIELFTAAQAIDFRRPLKTSSKLEKMMSEYRKRVPFLDNDTFMSKHMHESVDFIREYELEI